MSKSDWIYCTYCKEKLYDMHAISGSLDAHYATADQDFGCDKNPMNTKDVTHEHNPDLESYYL